MSPNEFLSLEPLRLLKRSMDDSQNRHLVRRMSWNPKVSPLIPKNRKRDVKRSANIQSESEITIETAVFVDAFLYNHMARTNFPDDTEQEMTHFVLTMINAVISRVYYHHPESLSGGDDMRHRAS